MASRNLETLVWGTHCQQLSGCHYLVPVLTKNWPTLCCSSVHVLPLQTSPYICTDPYYIQIWKAIHYLKERERDSNIVKGAWGPGIRVIKTRWRQPLNFTLFWNSQLNWYLKPCGTHNMEYMHQEACVYTMALLHIYTKWHFYLAQHCWCFANNSGVWLFWSLVPVVYFYHHFLISTLYTQLTELYSSWTSIISHVNLLFTNIYTCLYKPRFSDDIISSDPAVSKEHITFPLKNRNS